MAQQTAPQTAQQTFRNVVDGESVDSVSGETYEVVDPSTGEVYARAPLSGAEDVDRAYAAAQRAFGSWGRTTPQERSLALLRIADALESRAEEFVAAECRDTGKPLGLTASEEMPPTVDHFRFFAGAARVLEGKSAGEYMEDHTSFIRREPIGVIGQVTPWNYPLPMMVWKIAPALAAGNTVVLKPAETTPLTALLFADICRQAELPPGVVNIITGDGRAGAALVEHEDVDKIAFTGSTAVGKEIARTVAGTRKKLTLELGGKGANIVFDDAPIDQAVEGIVNGIYLNQGHVCCAGSRLFVQESVFEEVVAKLKRRMATLRVGDPLDKNTDVGAINSQQQLEKIKELVAAGEEEGAEIYQPPCRLPEKGWWFVPTVFTNVAQS